MKIFLTVYASTLICLGGWICYCEGERHAMHPRGQWQQALIGYFLGMVIGVPLAIGLWMILCRVTFSQIRAFFKKP